MDREQELLEVIHKGNDLIAVQDELINNYEKQVLTQNAIIKKQEDIINLLKVRIEELEA